MQCLRALPNKDGMLKNDIFIEAVRYILGLPSHIVTMHMKDDRFEQVGTGNFGRTT